MRGNRNDLHENYWGVINLNEVTNLDTDTLFSTSAQIVCFHSFTTRNKWICEEFPYMNSTYMKKNTEKLLHTHTIVSYIDIQYVSYIQMCLFM